jgi:hypothetical protein
MEQPGYDGLSDRWATNCTQAEALMDRLEGDIRSFLEDSQANALSLDERWDRRRSTRLPHRERKIWKQVARLEVPEMATLMTKVHETDLAIIKKCEEDLKQARNHNAIVQQIIIKKLRHQFGHGQDPARQVHAHGRYAG